MRVSYSSALFMNTIMMKKSKPIKKTLNQSNPKVHTSKKIIIIINPLI